MQSKLSYITFLFCLFSVKVILIPLGESGIRADDFLIGACAVALAVSSTTTNNQLPTPVIAYLALLGWQLCTAVIGAANGRVALGLAVVFVLRQAEYMIFYWVGKSISESRGEMPLNGIRNYAYALAILVAGQILGVFPNFSEFDNSRASGNTNGPYELAVVSVYLYYQLSLQSGHGIPKLLASAVLLATASRITFAAQIAVSPVYEFRKGNVTPTRVLAIATAALVGYIAVGDQQAPIESNTSVLSRLSSAGEESSISKFFDIYPKAVIYPDYQSYYDGIFFSSMELSQKMGGDDSGNIRIIRWTTLIKTTLAKPSTTIVGLGPSFGSAAVDGYYTRVFIESGIVGILLFLYFSATLLIYLKNRPEIRSYFTVMLITAIFIDIFVSYKPMILLWAWLGSETTRKTSI